MEPAAKRRAGDDRLSGIAGLAREAGALSVADEADALAARVEEGRFYVACVGQHKRGKSTLLNALLGEPLLPMGIVPLTSVATVVRHGAARRARVKLRARGWVDVDPAALAEFVTEERNPGNAKEVLGAEVFLPHAALEPGMCLVDTPGIGSVFAQNTAATREIVPHLDAAIAVLGVDPPISGEERDLVAEIAGHVRDLVFAVNKADRVPGDDLERGCVFTERVLAETLGRAPGRIFRVSAAERLAGAASPEWDALVATVEGLARESGASLVRAAAERGVARLGSLFRRELDERRDALVRPIAETERRVERLEAFARDAAVALEDLAPLLDAAQSRLAARLRALRDERLEPALAEAHGALRGRIASFARSRASTYREEATRAAQEIARAAVDRLRRLLADEGEGAYREAASRFAEIARAFVRRLAESGDPAFASLADDLELDVTVRVPPKAYFTEMLPRATPSPQRRLAEILLPAILLRPSIRRRAGAYLATVVETNAARVVNDLDDRARESRRRLEAEIRGHLGDGATSARRALEAARAQRALGEDAVAASLEKIEDLRGRLDALTGGAATPRTE